MRIGLNIWKSGLRAQNRRIQLIVIALRDCWRIAQFRICPDRLKRCSASSLGISLSRYSASLFGIRSIDGQLFRHGLIYFKWAHFPWQRIAKMGATNKADFDLIRCFRVWQIKPSLAVWPEKRIANKAF